MRITLTASGKELELQEGAMLELTDKNIIFGFDDIQCQRTSNITIPATPKNLAALEFGNDFHTSGDYYRRRLSAIVTEGVTTIDGYLYISQYNHETRKLSACFVGGDLTNLIAIKDAGVLSNYLKPQCQSSPAWSAFSSAHSANESGLENTPYTSVKRNYNDPRPSYTINGLLRKIQNYFGVTVPLLSGGKERVRIEPAKVNGFSQYTGKYIESGPVLSQSVDISQLAQEGTQIFTTENTYLNKKFGASAEQTYILQCVKTRTPITITIPNNVHWENGHTYAFVKGGQQGVSGMYQGTVIDTIVRGGEYTFETGDIFCIVDMYYYSYTSSDKGYSDDAFDFSGAKAWNIKIESSRDLAVGDAVRERDNLPEITVIDLLKACAAIMGKVLLYNPTTNAFSYGDVTQGNVVEIEDTEKVTEQKRTVGSFAQNNIVSFNHDSVKERYEVKVNYPITNENIDETKEVLKMPFSEGNGETLVEVVSENTPTIYTANASSSSQTRCSKIALSRNNSLASIFQNATEVTIQVPMTMVKYSTLQPLTQILWRNTLWTWREKQWKNGSCKLILVKI